MNSAVVEVPQPSLRHRIAWSPPVSRAVLGARGAPLVRERARFVLGQIGTRVGRYTLRDSGLSVFLRHGSRDVQMLVEIEGNRIYTAPPEVERALAAAGPSPKVADLGGNIGLFGTWILGRCEQAQVTTYEPDPHNTKLLRSVIAANGLGDRWTLVEACAAAEDGIVNFSAGKFCNSLVVDEGESGIPVPAHDVLPLIREADLVKIDIEGSEWDILADPRFRETRARALAIEWHLARSPSPDARGAAIQLLEAAGFATIPEPSDDPRSGTIWAYKEA